MLDPGGAFVIECFVPDLTRFDRGQRVQARTVTEDSAILELSRHDVAQQRITTQIVTFDRQGTHLRPVALRYSWPSELDLMAQQAGLRLRERYSGWNRQSFDSGSCRGPSKSSSPSRRCCDAGVSRGGRVKRKHPANQALIDGRSRA